MRSKTLTATTNDTPLAIKTTRALTLREQEIIMSTGHVSAINPALDGQSRPGNSHLLVLRSGADMADLEKLLESMPQQQEVQSA